MSGPFLHDEVFILYVYYSLPYNLVYLSPALIVHLGPHYLNNVGSQYGANGATDIQWVTLEQSIEKSGCVKISRSSGVNAVCPHGFNLVCCVVGSDIGLYQSQRHNTQG